RDAAVNLRRPIDLHLLGPACQIEYANKRTIHASSQQNLDKKKILVCQIPSNVSENDLRQLFGNCHLEKYYPAVIIFHEATMAKTKDDANILLGEHKQGSSKPLEYKLYFCNLTDKKLEREHVVERSLYSQRVASDEK
ncbi:unnamed protein product, partial [Adineta steineri]